MHLDEGMQVTSVVYDLVQLPTIRQRELVFGRISAHHSGLRFCYRLANASSVQENEARQLSGRRRSILLSGGAI